MEFVEGEGLEKLIRRSGCLETDLALRIVEEAAEGLEAIDKQHLVHRDLKPSNIMVSVQCGSLETAKIIDLGLAKGVAEENTLSAVGAFVGTPAYASPEQFAGIATAGDQGGVKSSKEKPRKQTIRWVLGAGLCFAIVLIAWFLLSSDAAFLSNQRRDSKRDLRQIASALGVANVLEGTVRRDGNHVRVSTELVDARNDNTIWADSYDRYLTDIFAIQSEIAQTVASRLSAKLSPEERKDIEERATNNLEAYDLYLQAKELLGPKVLLHSG
jgi:serine/threonine protein kinase